MYVLSYTKVKPGLSSASISADITKHYKVQTAKYFEQHIAEAHLILFHTAVF